MTSWIKMRTNLLNDPRVKLIAKRIHCNAVSVTGGLYVLWSLADEYSTDGKLIGYDIADLDKMFGKEGFATALASPEVGWLIIGDNYLQVPRFDEHNGESAKARAQSAKRMTALRSRYGANATKPPPEEEEDIEEEKKHTKKEAAPPVDEIDEATRQVINAETVYRAYPKHVEPEPSKKAISEAVRYLRKKGTNQPWTHLLALVRTYADVRKKLNDAEPGMDQFIPACHRWMRKKRYEEDPADWPKEGSRVRRTGSTVAPIVKQQTLQRAQVID